MLFHFRKKFPQLNVFWDKYLEFQKRLDIPAKMILLNEGKKSQNYIFIEKGSVRAFFNNNGQDKTVPFFSARWQTQKLEKISERWSLDVPEGKRLVIMI